MADIHFEGGQFFRQRIILSIISGKSILISNIRIKNENPGLLPHEISLLRLMSSITDGTKLIIDPTGTKISYKPGILVGVKPQLSPLSYVCPNNRSLTYYLEALSLLAPFCKFPVDIKLGGITHCSGDISVDSFKSTTIPILKQLTLNENLRLDVISRGSKPNAGGLVHFFCSPIKSIKPIKWLHTSRIKRIRGVAYTNNTSNHFAVKLIDTVRSVFNDFLSDVWIYNDKCEGSKGGHSPGLGISITAEAFDGKVKSSDATLDNESIFSFTPKRIGNKDLFDINESSESQLPVTELKFTKQIEILGKLISWKLLSEIYTQSVVDTSHQYVPLFFMAIAEEHEVSQIKLSNVTPHTLQFLRHLRDFFGTVFDIDESHSRDVVTLKCVGVGIKNYTTKSI